MTTITPDARARLAKAMDERRLQLGLRWQEVAEHGGISLKSVYSARTGTSGIAALTQHGLETGLRWEPGSVQAILDGGDPAPAGASPQPIAPQDPPEGLLSPAEMNDAMGEYRDIIARLARLQQNEGIDPRQARGNQLYPQDAVRATAWDTAIQAGRMYGFNWGQSAWFAARAVRVNAPSGERRNPLRKISG